MNCPKCGTPNPDGQKFCGNCGAELAKLEPVVDNHVTGQYTYTDNQYAYQQPNKKKHGCLTAFLIVVGVFFAFIFFIFLIPDDSDDSTSENQTKQEVKNDGSKESASKEEDDNLIDVDIHDCHVKYLRSSIEDNYVGDSCLVIYYEFTNNSDENKSFDYTIGAKAFQGGVELDSSLFHVNGNTKDSGADIQPGTTVEVASAYELRDNSEITLEVSNWLSDNVKDSMKIQTPAQ